MISNKVYRCEVDSTRIIVPKATALTKGEFCDAIDSLAKVEASKYYIRMSGHGNTGIFAFRDSVITSAELCNKLKIVADKGKPICLIINSCLSGSLLDADKWGFPSGSVIITSADSTRTSSLLKNGIRLLNADGTFGNRLTESAYQHAHNECLKNNEADKDKNNKVDDCEAYNWVIEQKPCYGKKINPVPFGTYTVDTIALYPAGSPSGAPDTTVIINGNTYNIFGSKIAPPNPMPQIQKVGDAPSSQGTNAQNQTGSDQTSFKGVYQGDLTGAIGLAYASDADGNIGPLWANGITTAYDPMLNQTTVTWAASGVPALPNDYVYFLLEMPPLLPIRPLQQFWGTQGLPLPIPPILEPELYIVGQGVDLVTVLVNKGLAADGSGQTIEYNLKLRVSEIPIPSPEFYPGDPFFLPPPVLEMTGLLLPDQLTEIPLPVPDLIVPGQFLITELCTKLPAETNFSTIQLSQWTNPLQPPLCQNVDVEIVPLSLQGVDPIYINTSGNITVNGTNIQSTTKSVLNAGNEIRILPPSTIFADAHLLIYGCDGNSGGGIGSQAEEAFEFTQLIEQRTLQNSSKESENTQQVTIVPNPFTEQSQVQYKMNTTAVVSLRVLDLNGRQLLKLVSQQIQAQGEYAVMIDLAAWKSGIYVAILSIDDELIPLKLVKQ